MVVGELFAPECGTSFNQVQSLRDRKILVSFLGMKKRPIFWDTLAAIESIPY